MSSRKLILKLSFLFTLWSCTYVSYTVADLTDGDCSLDGYNTETLTSASSWVFQYPSKHCKSLMNTSPNCTYLISFCKSMPSLPSPCNGSSVCIQGEGGSTQAPLYSLGDYTASPFFKYKSNKAGFVARFEHGSEFDQATNSTRNVTVAVHFTCGTNPWAIGADKAGLVPPPYNVVWNTRTFVYTIQLQYPGACGASIGPADTDYVPLSVGTILIITFFSVMTVYCVTGCAVKACRGYKGAEIIPNDETWANMPDYVSDGCGLVCKAICCCCRAKTPLEMPKSHTAYDSI